jgi:hypothetical protein
MAIRGITTSEEVVEVAFPSAGTSKTSKGEVELEV